MLQHNLENQTRYRRRFPHPLLQSGESIALFLRCENPAAIPQRIVPFDQVIRACELGWLAKQNCVRTNVCLGANQDLSAEGTVSHV
jgi:hypothetical protein